MTWIRRTEDTLDCIDDMGNRVETGRAGTDDSAMIQNAIDRMETGGELRLNAGIYTLSVPLVVHFPVTISGEGRGTEIVPPPGEFAFKVHFDNRSPDRTLSNFGVPPAHADAGITWQKLRSTSGSPYQLRHQGVHISRLAIQGHGIGKGILLATLTESTFRDLWIMNTGDGSGLYFEEEVMECVFENIHISNCGSPESKQAAITIRSQEGDACNNLHFRDIYVIFPQYIGIEIGSEGKPNHPRLIWFEHCMIHGWHVLTEPAPYDLIDVVHTDSSRGISFSGCRVTNGGSESACLRVRDGRVGIHDTVLGGGRGAFLTVAEPGANLHVTRSTFHDTDDLKSVLRADLASLSFIGNQVEVSRGHTVFDLNAPVYAVITDNYISIPESSRAVRIADSDDSPSGPVSFSGNVVVASGNDLIETNGLATGTKVVERDNLYV